MPPVFRKLLYWLGSCLALMGIIFIICRLRIYWSNIDFASIAIFDWGIITTFSLIYASANLLLALAWCHLLTYLGASSTYSNSIRIYGISQLAKYLPGNVFHFAGRQAIGMASGIPGWVLVKSSIWELSLICTAGFLYCWLILPLLLSWFSISLSIALWLISILLAIKALQQIVNLQLAITFIFQLFFLFISGSLFTAICILIFNDTELSFHYWFMVCGAYIAAWLIGLITPGSPAGVGIRELILVFLLNGLISEVSLLKNIILSRLITVSGDLVFFASAFLFRVKHFSSKV